MIFQQFCEEFGYFVIILKEWVSSCILDLNAYI
jgi:hypothetical protein